MQQGDVLLTNTLDGGEITVENGIVAMDGGLETAVYISIFGGSASPWWGDYLETESVYKLTSETEKLKNGLPLTSDNLKRIEEAVLLDIDWLKKEKIVSNLGVSAFIVDINRIQLDVTMEAFGDIESFQYTENWTR